MSAFTVVFTLLLLLTTAFCFVKILRMYIYQLFTNFGQGADRFGLLNVVAFVFALFCALILHEIAHGYVALLNGDETAKLFGRLSLNPFRHFDILGLVLMLCFGFGWAKPVPVNPNHFRNRKLGCVTVAIAGVVTNLVLAFFACLGVVLLSKANYASEGQMYLLYFLFFFCQLLATLNISFALFNLLPLYPLDGYRLLSTFFDDRHGFMSFLRKYSFYILIGLLVIDNIPIVESFSPINLYIVKLGNWIFGTFCNFWRLIF